MKSAYFSAVILLTALPTIPAQQAKIPTINADNTAVAHPPASQEPGVKGYGVRGVEGETLDEMIASCRVPTALTPVQRARCAQLTRSLKAQPDGTLQQTLDKGK